MLHSKLNVILSLAAMLFFSLSLSAQQNFIDGYIVSLKGDTTQGLVNYKNWRKNPNSVEFKINQNAEIKTYEPRQISSFAVKINNTIELYQAATVNLESSGPVQNLDYKRTFEEKLEDLFLLNIHQGAYTLYKYYDQKEHYFLGKKGDIIELRFKNYLSSDQKTVLQNEEYKATLQNFLQDCSSISDNDIKTLNYNEKLLIKILKKYDQCKSVISTHSVTEEKAKFVFGIVVATDVSNLNVEGFNKEISPTSAGNFAIGGSIAFKLPRNNESSSFNLELLYRKYKFDTRIEEIKSAEEYYKYHYVFSGNYIKTNIMYRYQWTKVKLKPFLNLGISQAFKLSKIDKSSTERRFYSTTQQTEEPLFADERGYEQGLNFGAGIALGKINFELRAETTNGFADYIGSKTAINSLFLNLNYTF